MINEITPIREGIQDIPKALMYPSFQSIEGDEEKPELICYIVINYLRKFATKDADKTCGIYDKDGHFYIGDTRVGVIDDNNIVGDKEYERTPGLWELIIMRITNDNVYTPEDYEDYAEIMVKAHSLRRDNNPNNATPKASRGWKLEYRLKNIWDQRQRFEGQAAIVIPSDPNALLERFHLLMASYITGNTRVRNEIVSIADELKIQKNLWQTINMNI